MKYRNGIVVLSVGIGLIVLTSLILTGTALNGWKINTISFYLDMHPPLAIVYTTLIQGLMMITLWFDYRLQWRLWTCVRIFFNYSMFYALIMLAVASTSSYHEAHMAFSYMAVLCAMLTAMARLGENFGTPFLILYVIEWLVVASELGIVIAFLAMGLTTSTRDTGLLEYSFYVLALVESAFRLYK